MTKQAAIELHAERVAQRRAHRAKNLSPYGGFTSETAEAYDKVLEREISYLGQAHNAKISRKAQARLEA